MGARPRSSPDFREQITASMEDYLEAIHELCEDQACPEVRGADIARSLKVSRPSVVGMIRHLSEHGLVRHSRYGRVSLTLKGKEVAREMAHRHRVLQRFLEEVLGLDAEVAERDACRMEHTLSPKTIDRFIALEEFRELMRLKKEPPSVQDGFRKFLKERESASPTPTLRKKKKK